MSNPIGSWASFLDQAKALFGSDLLWKIIAGTLGSIILGAKFFGGWLVGTAVAHDPTITSAKIRMDNMDVAFVAHIREDAINIQNQIKLEQKLEDVSKTVERVDEKMDRMLYFQANKK